LQLTQEPVHPTLQQTPSAQKPEPHSLALAQGMPFAFRPQVLLMHGPLLAQSELDTQLVRHALIAGSQLNGAQTLAGPGRQRPSPSQTLVLVTAAPSHAPALQTIPAGYLRQWPWPSQLPSNPQVATGEAVHVPAGAGMPTGTNVQTPGAL